MLKIKTFVCNFIEENCYIFYDDRTKDAVIIDCGARSREEEQEIADFVREEQLRLSQHLLTHGHFDHIWGADFIYKTFGLKPRLHAEDFSLYTDVENQMQQFLHHVLKISLAPLGKDLKEGSEIPVGSSCLKVIHTPGHSRGCVCFYAAEENVLFSGDTLFRHSVGRTDLPGGSYEELIYSVENKLFRLPPETIVFPGHGPATSIDAERRTGLF